MIKHYPIEVRLEIGKVSENTGKAPVRYILINADKICRPISTLLYVTTCEFLYKATKKLEHPSTNWEVNAEIAEDMDSLQKIIKKAGGKKAKIGEVYDAFFKVIKKKYQ